MDETGNAHFGTRASKLANKGVGLNSQWNVTSETSTRGSLWPALVWNPMSNTRFEIIVTMNLRRKSYIEFHMHLEWRGLETMRNHYKICFSAVEYIWFRYFIKKIPLDQLNTRPGTKLQWIQIASWKWMAFNRKPWYSAVHAYHSLWVWAAICFLQSSVVL